MFSKKTKYYTKLNFIHRFLGLQFKFVANVAIYGPFAKNKKIYEFLDLSINNILTFKYNIISCIFK